MKFHRSYGFTLIELMLVVAIVAILAAIAMPNYSNYVVKASREAAQSELLTLAGLQEKIYLNSNSYTASVTNAYNGTSAAANGLGRTGGQTTDGKYALSFLNTSGVGQTYTLAAQPVSGKKQQGNGCITIQENGKREWHENKDACDSATPKAW